MNHTQSKIKGLFEVSPEEMRELLRSYNNKERIIKLFLYFIGIIFSFMAVGGALTGYRRAYERFMRKKNILPFLSNLFPITRVAMVLGAIAALLSIAGSIFFVYLMFRFVLPKEWLMSPGFFIYIGVNILLSRLAFVHFSQFQADVFNEIAESERFGTGRYAEPEEFADLVSNQGGHYIGGYHYVYTKQSHLLTVAGTRSGKGTNIIIPNLLGWGGYKGSWVVLDVKGENAAITARRQRELGQNVLILDPWLQQSTLENTARYNPLDLFETGNQEALVDHADVIAEMIIPKDLNSKDPFFSNRARAFLAALLIHLAVSGEKEDKTLKTIWEWLRLPEEKWLDLLGDMSVSDNSIVKAAAHEMQNIKSTSERTYGSILSTLHDETDFLKSPSLQRSLANSNFNTATLSEGRTTLYVIIPPDKIETYYKWLRLVITSAMRSVVSHHDKRVTFLLDEFAILGYLPEMQTALSTYAGYNITVWPILQDLGQLKKLYKDNWETFLGNTAVRQFFNISDEFTMKYLSGMFGDTTYITYEKTLTGKSSPKATSRKLATPDEIRRGSANNIFLLVEQRPPAYVPKIPYYTMPELDSTYDPNPYYKPDAEK